MQIINGENLIHYLFDKGFTSPESVINSEVKIIPVSSRNRNFKILINNKPGYLVKQISAPDEEKMRSLRQEAILFWLVKNDPQYQSLSKFMPAFHDFEENDQVLTIELIENSQDLFAYYQLREHVSTTVFEGLSSAFSEVHLITSSKISGSASSSFFDRKIPWIFFIGQGKLPPKNNIDMQIMKLVCSNNEFIHHIEQLRKQWTLESLIHGDVKWANILITDHEKVKIIDWEISDVGDPAWDIAGIFQSVLNSWYFSIAGFNHEPNGLTEQKVSLQFFWDSYCVKMGYSSGDRKKRLQKIIGYTALRVIQTCLESTFKAVAFYDNTARYLQLAHNILRYRDDAQTELFGIKE